MELLATNLMPTQPDQTAQEMIVHSVRRFITTEREKLRIPFLLPKIPRNEHPREDPSLQPELLL